MPTNKFHYIWMGRLPNGKYEDSFKNGPNALAKQLKEYVMDIKKTRTLGSPNPQNQEIIMWVPEALINGIKEAGYLDPDITLKATEDLYKNAKHLTKEERDNLKKTVDLLGEYNAYSAQKDILQAAILEEYGGYYLDTTTAVKSIEKLINNPPTDLWFPRVSQYAQKEVDGINIILPDVWAMYVPTPGEGTCKAMLDSYVQRCQFYFPEKFEGKQLDLDKLKDNDGYFKTGYEILPDEPSYGKGKKIMASSYRDELIGQLVIISLCSGLKQTKGLLTDELMNSLSSFAEQAEEGKYIKELGIEKFYKGMWRTQEVANRIDQAQQQQQQQTASPTKNSFHLFEVQESSVRNFKIKYQSLKGDSLKSQILSNFKEKISAITDIETLNHFVTDFKNSSSYEVLTTPQGLVTKLLSLDTDSKKRVDEMINSRENEIIELSKSNSLH